MKFLLSFSTWVVCWVIHFTSLCAQVSLPSSQFQNFDKVKLEKLNGQVTIVLGKNVGISVEPAAAVSQLSIHQEEGILLVQSKKQFQVNGKMLIPATIVITMPEISKLYNFSNADVVVEGFVGRYLGCENVGNGNISLNGTVVDFLEMVNTGNGNLDAKNLAAKKVDIQKRGNGDAVISTPANFEVTMDGNGDVVNFGTGKAVIRKQIGTGRVVYRP